MKLLSPTARRILEDLDSLTYLMERGDGRVRREGSNSDYWEVGAEELASAAFLSRRLGRLLTRLEKKGEQDLQAIHGAVGSERAPAWLRNLNLLRPGNSPQRGSSGSGVASEPPP